MFCNDSNCSKKTFAETFEFLPPNAKKSTRLDNEIVDKSVITKVRIDDFAKKKRHIYGTVMIDIGTKKIVDLLDSRDLYAVVQWLKSYPNLKIVSRDGSLSYAAAIRKAHSHAVQISDRFHLLKDM